MHIHSTAVMMHTVCPGRLFILRVALELRADSRVFLAVMSAMSGLQIPSPTLSNGKVLLADAIAMYVPGPRSLLCKSFVLPACMCLPASEGVQCRAC